MNRQPCPILHLAGAPRERGRAHGEQLRAMIQAFVEEHFAFLEFSATHIVGVSIASEHILRVSDEFLPACERFAPDLVEEVRGIAEASGVPFRDIFSLNTFIDLADMVRPETTNNYLHSITVPESLLTPTETSDIDSQTRNRVFRSSGGCTSFGAMSPASCNGRVYLGQTFDTKAVFEPYVCALQIGEQDVHQPRTLVATFAGIVGCAGINAFGVGVVINHLHTYDARPGVPFTFAVRKMLQASSGAEALDILARSEPASGIHYLVGDENELRGAETSATRFEILHPRQGVLSHANHCDEWSLKDIEVEPSIYSVCRGNRAAEMLDANMGTIDARTLKDIACDHVGADDTICSHVENDAPRLRQYKTDFAVILDTHERAMDLFVGSPCENRIQRLGL